MHLRSRRLAALLAFTAVLATCATPAAIAGQPPPPVGASTPAPTSYGEKVGREDPRHPDLFQAKFHFHREGNPNSTTLVDWWPISGFTLEEQHLIVEILKFALAKDPYSEQVRFGDLTRPKDMQPGLAKLLGVKFKQVNGVWVPNKSLILPISATNTSKQFHAEFNAQRLYTFFEYAKRMLVATRGLSVAQRREIWQTEITAYLAMLEQLAEMKEGWEAKYIDAILRGIPHNGVFPESLVRMVQAGLLDNQSCGSGSGSRCTLITPEMAFHNLYDTQRNIQLSAARTAITNTQDIMDELLVAMGNGDFSSSSVDVLVRALDANLQAALGGVTKKLSRNAPMILGTRVNYLETQLNLLLHFLQQAAAILAQQPDAEIPESVRHVQGVVNGLGKSKKKINAKPMPPKDENDPDQVAASDHAADQLEAVKESLADVKDAAKGAPDVGELVHANQAKGKGKQLMATDGQCVEHGSLGRPYALALTGAGLPSACPVRDAAVSGLDRSIAAAAGGRNGGIDLRSLELRYLSDKPGEGHRTLGYAFSAKGAETYDDQHLEVGLKNARQASDAFFVWLAMPRESFWVNLNPEEPNRIVDTRLGTTDVGRVLLEADLEMKKTVGRLIHPETEAGLRFWDEMGVNACFSFRNWIVARPATVYDSGDELYIVDAPLEALSESHYLKDQGVAGTKRCKLSKSEEERLEKLYAKRILPKLNKAINTAPEYAELRRVYLSRVAAEWYRQRAEKGHATAYGSIIDSGDVSRWRYEGKWRPRDTFNDFLDSHKKGEFNIKKTYVKDGTKYTRSFVYGGVDWDSVVLRRLNAAELQRKAPGVAAQVKRSIGGKAVEPGGERVWVGGSVPVKPAGQTTQERSGIPLGVYLGILIAILLGIGVIIWRARHGLRPTSKG